jgi:inward rectifier potassium channel
MTRQTRRERPRLIKVGTGDLHVIGMPKAFFSDLYYVFLNRSWRFFYAMMLGAYALGNGLFALLYALGGDCIANARPGSLVDAFFFSVQTMGTIGFGYMYPKTTWANALVTAESAVSIFSIATVTGLTFAKFSKPRARVNFSANIVVSRHDGVPTLMFRMANARANYIAEAQLHVVMMRRGRTLEGRPFNKLIDLNMARSRTSTFTLTWTALHPIDAASPLRADTLATLQAANCQIICSIVGFDVTTGQTIHARHTYNAADILWDTRFRDILLPSDHGPPRVDYLNFHSVEPDGTPA